LMNLWIVCHDGYRYASMQEGVLLGIRGLVCIAIWTTTSESLSI
jgi:hypothetical protein